MNRPNQPTGSSDALILPTLLVWLVVVVGVLVWQLSGAPGVGSILFADLPGYLLPGD